MDVRASNDQIRDLTKPGEIISLDQRLNGRLGGRIVSY
jgi:hypothetical protein